MPPAVEYDRPDWLPGELYPFASHFADLGGCRVHYVDEGEGPTLLMLHGNPTWSFLYRRIILALRDRFRCVALDYPGFGLSIGGPGYGFRPHEHARIVAGLVDHLGLADILLFGHDWGGPIGLWDAGRRPKLYAGFVLGNTFAWPLDHIRRFRAFSRVMGGSVGRQFTRTLNGFVNVILPLGTHTPLSHSVMECYRGPFRTRDSRDPMHIFARELVQGQPFLREVELGLAELEDHPALLLWGEGDLAFRRSERFRFEEVFPGHEIAVMANARHYIQEDRPQFISAAIEEWSHLPLSPL